MSGAERRQWPRIPASLLSNLTASIIAGPDVKLVNLSRGGALMEVAARYPMRSRVRLKLTRPEGGVTQVNGTVSWAKVASISNGKINYLLAVIFENPIEDLAAATGLSDIENQAGVSMVTDPFEDTDVPAIAVSLAANPTPEAPLVTAPPAGLAEPEPLEEDISHVIFPSAGDLPPLGANAISTGRAPDQRTAADRDAHVTAAARAEELRRELDRAAGDLAELSAANDNLSAQLQAYDEDRIRLRSELEAARLNWHDEKSSLMHDAAQSAARVQELQAALELHQRSGGEALAEQQALAQTLSTRLGTLEREREFLRADLEAERTAWAGRLADEQHAWHEERIALSAAAAAAAADVTALEARLGRIDAERAEWEAGREAERASWREERQGLVQQADAAAANVEALEEALRSLRDDRAREVAEQQALLLSLTAQLEVFDAERLQLQRELEGERAQWAAERAALVEETDARTQEFQAALDAREQHHADALAREQRGFEQLVAELMQAANDQQAEYQQLMAERTAAFEEQVSRVERVQAELARVSDQAEQQLRTLRERCHQLEARAGAAEEVSVALETRHREVRREAERLVALLGSQGTEVAVEQMPTLLGAADDSAQAVA